MLGLLKAIVPTPLKRRVKRLLGIPETRLHGDWAVLGVIGPIAVPHVVLDIGAHHGWFFHCWQDWCPQAEIHAFEPFPASFDIARQLYGSDSRVTLNQVGVGDAVGQLSFNVCSESDVSNSFLEPAAQAWESIHYHTGAISQIHVPVTTIDRYVQDKELRSIYLAKIDVQGFEMQVLKGAESSLHIIDHIFVEVGIERLYQGAPRFNEIFEYLTARGFHLMAMRAWHRGNHVLQETDMLFRRNGLAPPVDDSVIKVMEKVG